jgi:hypothetical protein
MVPAIAGVVSDGSRGPCGAPGRGRISGLRYLAAERLQGDRLWLWAAATAVSRASIVAVSSVDSAKSNTSMFSAFSEGADFSRITAAEGLRISAVKHATDRRIGFATRLAVSSQLSVFSQAGTPACENCVRASPWSACVRASHSFNHAGMRFG